MGRKRTHHDATRTKIVSARLKHETYDLISEHAQKLGLSRAGYIEHLIENRPLRIMRPLSDELPMPLLNELKRIGNNLNQMAHARNAGLDVDPRQFRTVVSEIIATICSNEVLKRRYDGAVAELGDKRGAMIEEELRLQKRATPSPAILQASPEAKSQPAEAVTQAPRGSGELKDSIVEAAPAPKPGAWPEAPVPARPPAPVNSEPPAREHAPPVRRPAAPVVPDRGLYRPVKKDDPKTSSSWFKLPWSLHLRSSRR